MIRTIEAVYENGVIKPLQKIHFKEHEHLSITISKIKREKTKNRNMSIVGIFESGIKDLSMEHDQYLYGRQKTK